mmetsp:Transcript_41850/g.67322  ORF Transcript_41850/g.67322 Transcript_41850/m.67322 type:complete len:207 (-) Transcript_41850:118-738(-)
MISIFFLFSLLGSASCVRRCRRVGAGSAILQSLTEERLLLAATKRMRGSSSSSSSSMTTKKIAASPFLRSQRDRRSDTVVPMRAAMQESLLTLASVDNNFVLGLEVWRLAWPFLLVWLLQRQMPVSPSVPVKKSRAQWREELTSEQFKVMVNRGTEMAFTSKLNVEKRNGTYTCAGCGNPLFLASQKVPTSIKGQLGEKSNILNLV